MTRQKAPSIRELPFVGSLLAYNTDRLNFYQRVMHECGPVGRFHLGPIPVSLVSGPEEIRRVLVEDHSAFRVSPQVHAAFFPLIGHGLLTSEGSWHRQQRKLMAPLFQPRQIIHYADSIVQAAEQTQEHWRNGQLLDLEQEMTQLTLRIISNVLFDANVANVQELGAAMAMVLTWINLALFLPFPRLFWPLSHRRTRQAAALLKQSIQQMIEERRVARMPQRVDLLSLLLGARDEHGEGMSDRQVIDECLTLFFAGHETTATALTWMWHLLTTHPEYYQRVQEEVDGVLQGRPPTAEDLARLPYSLQVLKESIRLYPPIHAIVRSVHQPGYRLGNARLPWGSIVLISPYALHRQPEYFPHPEQFDPERFTPEREKTVPRYAYLPFGAGPRICIGNHLAIMEGHLLLATLAQRVTFVKTTQHIESDPGVTLRSKGIQVRVQRRT
jgi:cytochrome P450